MASGTRTISLSTYDSPPSSPLVPRVPIAGEDARSMETHRLIQEKAKKTTDAHSLKGRVSTTTTPEKENKWADLSSSSGSYGSSLSASGGEDPRFNTSFDTPPSPVKKRKELTTPDAVQAIEGFLANEDLGYDLTPKSGETMTQAVEKLDDLDSPYRSEQKALVRAPFSAALVRTGSTSEISSPNVLRRQLFSIDSRNDISGKWTAILARSLEVSFLDTKHIENLEDGGGLHFCPLEHPLNAAVKHRRTNITTGIWCGKIFDLSDSQKVVKPFSSFFPQNMTPKRYKTLIAEAQGDDEREIARQDNRRLYEVVDGKNRFMIECYLQQSETLIKPFPIFHYEVYEGTEESFDVNYSFKLTRDGDDPLKQLTYKVVYSEVFELLLENPSAIVYQTDETIIIDLGILFENCPIDKGLFVEIPKKFLT